MSNYITYADKVGIVAKTVHINQWWDDDANEVKAQHNANDDRITVLEGLISTVPLANLDIFSGLPAATPIAGDLFIIDRDGTKYSVDYSEIAGGVTDHAVLTNLDYANAGHIGFQAELTPSATIDITANVISVIEEAIDHDNLTNYDPERHLLESELEITISQISDFDTIKNIFTINLPASASVATRVSGAVETTDYPTGWVLAAGSNPNDLEITHNLNRVVAGANVFYVDSGEQILLMANLGYTGLSAPDTNTLVLKGLSTKAFPLIIQLFFA